MEDQTRCATVLSASQSHDWFALSLFSNSPRRTWHIAWTSLSYLLCLPSFLLKPCRYSNMLYRCERTAPPCEDALLSPMVYARPSHRSRSTFLVRGVETALFADYSWGFVAWPRPLATALYLYLIWLYFIIRSVTCNDMRLSHNLVEFSNFIKQIKA